VTERLLVEGVRRELGGRRVVDVDHLEVHPGELLVLVGPSGCGKSTLLRIIAGLDVPQEGTIAIGSAEVTSLPPEQRRVGLVFQDHALFPHLSVGQNVAFGLRSVPRRERSARVAEVLELVRLPGAAASYPHELSGGEQQRVALARALAPAPDLVLLDEPFASLDASLRDELRNDVVTAMRRRGTTAVLVTHEREEALSLGDRVAVMDGGRLLQVDTAEAVYEQPATRFVASFLGDVSFLVDGSGRSFVARPHHISVEPGGPDVVRDRHYLGSCWRHEVQRSDGSVVLADAPPGAQLAMGAACRVVVAGQANLHELPAEDQRAGNAASA